MYRTSCDMVPETMAKLCSKNKDHQAHYTKGKNLLRIPERTIFFLYRLVIKSGMLHQIK